jgi:hypothetical protein
LLLFWPAIRHQHLCILLLSSPFIQLEVQVHGWAKIQVEDWVDVMATLHAELNRNIPLKAVLSQRKVSK